MCAVSSWPVAASVPRHVARAAIVSPSSTTGGRRSVCAASSPRPRCGSRRARPRTRTRCRAAAIRLGISSKRTSGCISVREAVRVEVGGRREQVVEYHETMVTQPELQDKDLVLWTQLLARGAQRRGAGAPERRAPGRPLRARVPDPAARRGRATRRRDRREPRRHLPGRVQDRARARRARATSSAGRHRATGASGASR